MSMRSGWLRLLLVLHIILGSCTDERFAVPLALDSDGDGFMDVEDCAPLNESVWAVDADGDGWGNEDCVYDLRPREFTRGRFLLCDCDDMNPHVRPVGPEADPAKDDRDCGDEVAWFTTRFALEDCDPETGQAQDYPSPHLINYDCADGQEDFSDLDEDGETIDVDCNDCDPGWGPHVTERRSVQVGEVSCPDPLYMYDDEDEDCWQGPEFDFDGDHQPAGGWGDTDGDGVDDCAHLYRVSVLGEDCDDRDPEVFLGHIEVCDRIDHDCSGDPLLSLPDAFGALDIDAEQKTITLHINPDGDGQNGSLDAPFRTLWDALAALPGCQLAARTVDPAYQVILQLSAGEHQAPAHPIDLSAYPEVDWIVIRGEEVGGARMRADGGPALDVVLGEHQSLRLERLELDGGGQHRGVVVSGGVFVELVDVNVHDAAGIAGPALNVDGPGQVLLDSCTFEDNTATSDGGALRVTADTTIIGSTFEGNEAPRGGAITQELGDLSIQGSTFSLNAASYSGGAISHELGDLTLDGCTFVGNEAVFDGGAIVSLDRNATITVSNTTFSQNTAGDDGGAISANVRAFAGSGLVVSENRAGGDGGALCFPQGTDVRLDTESAFLNNEAQVGGAVFVEGGGLEVQQVRFDHNVATGRSEDEGTGGAIYAELSTVDVRASRFVGNVADYGGGAYTRRATNDISLSVFYNNVGGSWDARQSLDGSFRNNIFNANIAASSVSLSRDVLYAYGQMIFEHNTVFDTDAEVAVTFRQGLMTVRYNIFAHTRISYDARAGQQTAYCNLFHDYDDAIQLINDPYFIGVWNLYGQDPGFVDATPDGDPFNDSDFTATNAVTGVLSPDCAERVSDELGALGDGAPWTSEFPSSFLLPEP
ncbi:MAG: right-handed parallel beta-helix repeat-containing protein [Alphaproteobacteria bacterium]|nr:right-handed parallel beta-helix repeat-containing protein [Alphaproteobacteria bacterium]